MKSLDTQSDRSDFRLKLCAKHVREKGDKIMDANVWVVMVTLIRDIGLCVFGSTAAAANEVMKKMRMAMTMIA